jgi:hypothetical protein
MVTSGGSVAEVSLFNQSSLETPHGEVPYHAGASCAASGHQDFGIDFSHSRMNSLLIRKPDLE